MFNALTTETNNKLIFRKDLKNVLENLLNSFFCCERLEETKSCFAVDLLIRHFLTEVIDFRVTIIIIAL